MANLDMNSINLYFSDIKDRLVAVWTIFGCNVNGMYDYIEGRQSYNFWWVQVNILGTMDTMSPQDYISLFWVSCKFWEERDHL